MQTPRSHLGPDGRPRRRVMIQAHHTEPAIHVECQEVADQRPWGGGLVWLTVYNFLVSHEEWDRMGKSQAQMLIVWKYAGRPYARS